MHYFYIVSFLLLKIVIIIPEPSTGLKYWVIPLAMLQAINPPITDVQAETIT